ncbi:FkbM family methyltransferase [Alphaproteobacteria bacterium]|nr:FkbM family methyltransferase [Alphaproteobacteria bacterium]
MKNLLIRLGQQIAEHISEHLPKNKQVYPFFNGELLILETDFGWHCFPKDQVNHVISYMNSDFDKGMKNWISNHCSTDTTYIDIGANAGTFCGIASRQISAGKIIAIEPLADLEDCIRMNVQLNNPSVEFHYHSCAIGPKFEEAAFEVFQFDNRVSTSVAYNNQNLADRTQFVQVTVKNINNLKINPTKHVVIKIDAEGAETDILEQVYKFTQAHRNIQYNVGFEYAPSHLERGGQSFERIYDIITRDFAVEAYFINELSGAEHPRFDPATANLSGNVGFKYVC